MNGRILDLEHFAVHDGPGIRLVVFLKGCPLHCRWCHTPESQRREAEITFHEKLCIGCGSCRRLFDELPLKNAAADSQIDRALKCPAKALEVFGKEVSAEWIVAEAMKEKAFFDESGGGLTLSGGEPLFQPEFTLDVLKLANANGIRCCIETCGFASYDVLRACIPHTELFLFDYKATGNDLHQRLTGVDQAVILSNLRKLNSDGARIILRCPLIPNINDSDEHLAAIASLAEELEHVEAVHVEPYNPLAIGKYEMLGREVPEIPREFPKEEVIQGWRTILQAHTHKPVTVP